MPDGNKINRGTTDQGGVAKNENANSSSKPFYTDFPYKTSPPRESWKDSDECADPDVEVRSPLSKSMLNAEAPIYIPRVLQRQNHPFHAVLNPKGFRDIDLPPAHHGKYLMALVQHPAFVRDAELASLTNGITTDVLPADHGIISFDNHDEATTVTLVGRYTDKPLVKMEANGATWTRGDNDAQTWVADHADYTITLTMGLRSFYYFIFQKF